MVTWVGLAVASNTVRINDVLKDRRELVGHVIGGRSLVGVNHVQYGRHSRTTPLLAHRHRQTHIHTDRHRKTHTYIQTDTHIHTPTHTHIHTDKGLQKTWQSV